MRTHLLRQRQRVDRPLRRGHVARLQQARAHHGVGGRLQFALRDLVPQQRQLGLRGLQLGLGASDVFLAWACLGQAQRFALFVRLGQGHLRGAAGAVHVLGADAAPLRVGGDAAQPRRSCRRARASACAATSRLRAWAISSGREPLRRRSSVCCCASICARAWSACSASVRVSSTASTAPAHAVAFGAQFLHAAIAVEGQRDLADVHVAVVDEIAAAVALAGASAPGGSDRPRRRR